MPNNIFERKKFKLFIKMLSYQVQVSLTCWANFKMLRHFQSWNVNSHEIILMMAKGGNWPRLTNLHIKNVFQLTSMHLYMCEREILYQKIINRTA